MPNLFSLAKTAIIATCLLSLSNANPSMLEQSAIVHIGEHVWTDTQHVFQTTTDKLKNVFSPSNEMGIFTHPAFSNYALRFKQPSLCDPNVKQVKTKEIIINERVTQLAIRFLVIWM